MLHNDKFAKEIRPHVSEKLTFQIATVTLLVIFLILFITFLILYIQSKNHVCTSSANTKLVKSVKKLIAPDAASLGTNKKSISQEKFSDPDNLQALVQKAKDNFVLSRYAYSSTPLITIVTRSFNRPQLLQRNIDMVSHMTNKNFEHVILQDQKGCGMAVAEASLYAFRDEFRGEYICHLDDDDYLSNFHFVDQISTILSNQTETPKVMIFKVWYSDRDCTLPEVWNEFPMEGQITTSNFLVEKDLYKQNISCVARKHAGDYTFIHNVLVDCPSKQLLWIDDIYFFISLDGH